MKTTRRVQVALVAIAASAFTSTAGTQQVYPYETGKDIYEHVCQACHMPGAKGASGAGAYPALAGNPRLETALYPVMIILRGFKSMPSFAELDDEQIVALTNYLRTNYGNNFAEPVTLEQVKTLRPTVVQQRRGRAG